MFQVIQENNTLLQAFILLRQHSLETYLVGGCVRDILSNKHPKDFDIVTSVPFETIITEFEQNGWRVQTAGANFLVCVVHKHGVNFEIANFRKDGSYTDGRRPDSVEIGTIHDDAFRRDFTINALYHEPFSDAVLDPTGHGLEDVRTKTLRFVGKPVERLTEDGLRALRFYRFVERGWVPHSKSLRAVREHFNDCVTKTTPERIREELEKIVRLV